ncbi:hypothetical protein Tco_0956021 [Tanacetum coccineum]|uniref:Uncharacterized protein n=1 Tax=Tanacetum coccineum TaxID=301880 RepID=A0ABQ5E8Y2_9ASTR
MRLMWAGRLVSGESGLDSCVVVSRCWSGLHGGLGGCRLDVYIVVLGRGDAEAIDIRGDLSDIPEKLRFSPCSKDCNFVEDEDSKRQTKRHEEDRIVTVFVLKRRCDAFQLLMAVEGKDVQEVPAIPVFPALVAWSSIMVEMSFSAWVLLVPLLERHEMKTTIAPTSAITSAKVAADLGLVLITGIAITIVAVVLIP